MSRRKWQAGVSCIRVNQRVHIRCGKTLQGWTGVERGQWQHVLPGRDARRSPSRMQMTHVSDFIRHCQCERARFLSSDNIGSICNGFGGWLHSPLAVPALLARRAASDRGRDEATEDEPSYHVTNPHCGLARARFRPVRSGRVPSAARAIRPWVLDAQLAEPMQQQSG